MKHRWLAVFLITVLFLSTGHAARFNSDYQYRHNISQTNTTSELLGPLNGTSSINENYDNQNHWIYGTWKGQNTENLSIYHKNQSLGGWNATKIANKTTEYCVIQTQPTNYTSCPNPPPGLISYYPLDENGNKAYDHISQNHGTINGGVIQGVSGEIAKGYSFDNNDDEVVVSNKPEYHGGGTGDFTGIAWVKPTDISNDASIDRNFVLIDRRTGTDPRKGWSLGFTDQSTARARVEDDDGDIIRIDAGDITDLNAWHMLTLVRENNKVKLYVNQSLVGENTDTNLDNISNSQDLRIGQTDNTDDNYPDAFNGDIDDVRLYNRSLSSKEIKSVYYNKASLGIEKTRGGNNGPLLTSNSPKNPNKNNRSGVTLEAEIGDPENDKMNLTFYNNSDDSQIDKIENVNNGTYSTTWNNLDSDTTHKYRIEITDGKDKTTSSTFSFTTIEINLTWDDNSDNENGFKIYNNATGSYQKIADVSTDSTSYRDTEKDLEFGKNTCYEVTSYNSEGESNPATGCITP